MRKISRFSRALLLITFGLGLGSACGQMNYESERQEMIEELRAESRLSQEYGAPLISEHALTVLGQVPRHEFVPEKQKPYAYQNRPLEIGADQTISQPYIVALMTDLAEITKDEVVLEIGTGSGYQAAVLAELVKQVYSIEIIEPLGQRARDLLNKLDYDNIETRIGDGYYGWEAHAPFDAIIVTAAASHVPPPLIKQLKVGGRMIIPVGSRFMTQQLLLIEKQVDEKIITKQVLPVRFVPLTGKH